MSLSASYAISAVFNGKDKLSPVINKIEKKYGSLAGSVARNVNKMNRSINKMAKVGAVAAGAVVVGLSKATIKFATAGDEAAKTSRRIGMSAEALQELSFAADRAGVSGQDTIKSFEKLNKNIGDLRAGTGSLKTILDKSNPALAKQLKNAKNNEEAFAIMTTAINKLPNQMDKAALAQAAFGRSGLKMLTVMENGTEGIASLREEAKKYGGIMSNDAAKASEAFIDSMANMKAVMTGLKYKALEPLMRTMGPYIQMLSDYLAKNKDIIGLKIEKVFKSIAGAIKKIDVKAIKNSFLKFLNVFKAINAIVNKLGGWKKFATIILSVVAGVKALVLAMNAYNVAMSIHATVMKLVSLAEGVSLGTRLGLLGVTISTTVATIAYKVAAAASVVATYAMTAAQWALNVAMDANPIGLIILGVAALAALITLIIVKWDTWGETILGVMAIFSPAHAVILGIITVVKSLKDNWDSLASSFQSGGFINGIKTLGAVIFQAVLSPLLAVVKLLEKIPGVAKLGLSDKLTGLMDSNQDFIDRDNSTKNKEAEIRNRYALAPNGQKAETEQTKAVLGAGTITVKAEQGSSATVNNGSMKKTGWNMEELGKDGAA